MNVRSILQPSTIISIYLNPFRFGGRLCRPQTRRAAKHLVTPFTPYVISNFYFSEEIAKYKLEWLHPKSRNLTEHAEEVQENDIVFCDVDLLRQFVEFILPRIRNPFILITGKWHSPALEINSYTSQLVSSTKVKFWFSQNMIIDDPKCHPFPYGISLRNACFVLGEMKKSRGARKQAIFFSFVQLHPHLSGRAREGREALQKHMQKPMSVRSYLANLHEHCFAASPVGDRPETYRHWEAIALGCVPISNVPDYYKKLFGTNMMYLSDMKDIFDLDLQNLKYQCPDPKLVMVDHWKEKIDSLIKNS